MLEVMSARMVNYYHLSNIVSGKVLLLLPRRVHFSNFVFTIVVPHRCGGGGATRALELAAASLACLFFFSQV